MNPLWSIWVPGHVVGKDRPRFTRSTGRVYTPDATTNYEQYLRRTIAQYWGDHPLEKPVAMTVRIDVEMPASWSAKRKSASIGQHATGKPDFDNSLKIIGDAGNKLLWKDDSLIADVRFVRVYAEEPGLFLAVSDVSPTLRASSMINCETIVETDD